MANEHHLYMIVHPINALVLSQLDPYKFADHYTMGSAKHFKGKVLFVELDINFRDPYFDIDGYLAQTVPHPNGSPKKTKFVSSYAVLEHVDFKAFKDLYLVTPNGKALGLTSAKYSAENKPGLVRIYQELAPLTNLVASTLDQRAFGKYITAETKSKGAPKVCFTQYEFNTDDFLKINRNRDLMFSTIPETNPARLWDYISELKETPQKKTKTINLQSVFTEVSFTLIRHGFWFAGKDELLFYPMPSKEELNSKYFDWWRFVR